MVDRPHQNLSEKFIAKVDRLTDGKYIPDAARFETNLRALLVKFAEQTDREAISTEAQKNVSNTPGSNSWEKSFTTFRSDFRRLHSLYQRILDEEAAIKRIETKAHRRAVFYRFLTTLAIGAGIMITYFVAQKLGINMPLIRVGI